MKVLDKKIFDPKVANPETCSFTWDQSKIYQLRDQKINSPPPNECDEAAARERKHESWQFETFLTLFGKLKLLVIWAILPISQITLKLENEFEYEVFYIEEGNWRNHVSKPMSFCNLIWHSLHQHPDIQTIHVSHITIRHVSNVQNWETENCLLSN